MHGTSSTAAIILIIFAILVIGLMGAAVFRLLSKQRDNRKKIDALSDDDIPQDDEQIPEASEETPVEDDSPIAEPSKPTPQQAEPAPAPEATTTRKKKKAIISRDEEKAKLDQGLTKTKGGFIARLGRLFSGPSIDASVVEQVEEVLFTADIGVKTSQHLMAGLKQAVEKQSIKNQADLWTHLRTEAAAMLAPSAIEPVDFSANHPFVLLVVGVNGVGKTTTIGKLAAWLKALDFKVLLAAGDTFRAAASQQLEVWGQRSDITVVTGPEASDPTSVIVDALKKGVADNFDVIIADTAGRLHTKTSLMDELQKVRRAIGKHVPNAPHETWLVVDATTGQNAIAQAKMFHEAISLSGIVLTKLDGTAKGGVVLGISHELALPIRFIGVGESPQDLRAFVADAFVDALFSQRND